MITREGLSVFSAAAENERKKWIASLKGVDPEVAFLTAYGFCDTDEELKSYFPEWDESRLALEYDKFKLEFLSGQG